MAPVITPSGLPGASYPPHLPSMPAVIILPSGRGRMASPPVPVAPPRVDSVLDAPDITSQREIKLITHKPSGSGWSLVEVEYPGVREPLAYVQTERDAMQALSDYVNGEEPIDPSN